MARKKSGGFGETVRTVVYAILIALVIRTFAYEPFNIPSGSMIPTLLEGDYLFVSKFSYGYSRYSMPFNLPLFSGRIFYTPPQRGDVMVFKLPADTSIDYIKRIIGLPGDRVQVIGGVVNINGEPVKLQRVADYVPAGLGADAGIPEFIETLPNGVSHPILKRVPFGQPKVEGFGGLDPNNTPVYTVPPDHYFVMGDNRDNSEDSRFLSAVGYIPVANLVGRAEFLFFSTDGSAEIWQIWQWPFATRYGRLFQPIH
jgi:signal peptidase I